MKSTILACMGAALLLSACSKVPQSGYVVEGCINGLPDSTVVRLTPISHESEKAIAEAVVINGKFTLAGEVAAPTAVRLQIGDDYPVYDTHMMVENGVTSLCAEALFDESGPSPRYRLGAIDIQGSENCAKFRELMGMREELNELHDQYITNNQETHDALMAARANGDSDLMNEIMATDGYKKLVAEEKDFFATVEERITNQILDNKDTFFGPLMMIAQLNYLTPKERDIYEQLSEEAKASLYGQKVREELYPAGQVGSPISNFESADINDLSVSLEKVASDNKVVILDFWASWCMPCRREIPNIKEIYAKHHADGLEIVSVSIDKEDADWRKAVAEEELAWLNVRDTDGDISSLYKIRAVPTIYVIDSDGKLAAENLRGAALAAAVDSLMALR